MKSGVNTDEAMGMFKKLVDDSWIRTEMEPTKNFHAGFANNGLIGGSLKYGLSKVFGPGATESVHEDHEGMKKVSP